MALPAIPSSAFAGGAAFSAVLYDKAVHYTRIWGTSVPEMYTSALGLDIEQANALFGKLVNDNVIATPNANGFARAVSPYFKAPVLAQTAAETASRSIKPKVRHHPLKIDNGSNCRVQHVLVEDIDIKEPQSENEPDQNIVQED